MASSRFQNDEIQSLPPNKHLSVSQSTEATVKQTHLPVECFNQAKIKIFVICSSFIKKKDGTKKQLTFQAFTCTFELFLHPERK